MIRKLSLFLVASVMVVLRADTAAAIDQAACCLPTTSRLDSLMNPTQFSGDEKFFSSPSGSPNILFIIDTSSSMYAWPTTWPTVKGCSHSFFEELGYDKDEVYPRLWTSMTTQSNEWFATNKYYNAHEDGYGRDFQSPPENNSLVDAWANVTDACKGVSTKAADRTQCQTCLDSKGYYVQDSSTRRVKGNFLNFYAPRDSGAVKVLADVVHALPEARFAVMSFETVGSEGCWKSSSGVNSLCMLQEMSPSCSYPLDADAMKAGRDTFLKNLTNNGSTTKRLSWGRIGTPLADTLYAAGYYFQSRSSGTTSFTKYFTSTHAKPGSAGSTAYNRGDAICYECGFNAVILLTDGDPNGEGGYAALPNAITKQTSTCSSTDCKGNLHKVAKYFWDNDMREDKGGMQRVATYTIGFSEAVTSSKLLQETARVGGGEFFPARSTSELKQALLKILDNINARSNAFTSVAVNSLQSQNSSQLAIIPRMVPASNKGWAGKLFRYEQFNEFVLNEDRNDDKDYDDVYLIDRNGDVVAETQDGDFRKITAFSTPATVTQFGEAAQHYWEAGEELKKDWEQGDETGKVKKPDFGRNIYTVTDNGRMKGGTKDGLINQDDELVEFKLEKLAELQQYLAVSGAPMCPSGTGTGYKPGFILSKMGLTAKQAAEMMNKVRSSVVSADPTSQADYDKLCAALVIQYVRGQDLFDEDGDGSRSNMRPSALGDIFHSAPVVVSPPVDKFLCDLGVSTQCVRTLYSSAEQLGGQATPLKPSKDPIPATCKPGAAMNQGDAYDGFHHKNRMRERLILVGANDGMLHAFSDSKGSVDQACNIHYAPVAGEQGGGKEVWAFIPSDLLPRLQDMLQGHAYYVDGDIMVRDIWSDDNNNGWKDEDEYHTVAVVAEGRGGTHYFALELRWDDAAKPAALAPGFRWMFPQPCTDEALRFGKTLFSLSPKSPPIGPVRFRSASPMPQAEGLPPKDFSERWVTMLSGGWSPGGEKGRGIYMVDVWNGKVDSRRDNLLWKWEFASPGKASSGADKTREFLKYGFVAPVAMADYGPSTEPALDGFFDTAVVGDLGGQLWTMRFHEPGIIDSSGLVTNWSAGRAFAMDRQDVSSSTAERVDKRSPFFYLSSLAYQQDSRALRAFVGTGNRYSILDEGVGICRYDNPQACSKLGCAQTLTNYKVTRGTSDAQTMNSEWGKGTYAKATSTQWTDTPASFNYCGPTTSKSFVKAAFDKRETQTCTRKDGGSSTYAFASTSVECGQYSSDVFDCRVPTTATIDTKNMGDLDVKQPLATSSSVGKNRFFGIWAYGGAQDRVFTEDPNSSSANMADKYDNRRLSDSNDDLRNVTDVVCKADGSCTCASGSTTCVASRPLAAPDSRGWFYEYDGPHHKTASGSAVLASCTMWNSMYSEAVQPQAGESLACSGSYTSRARLFQADFITGAPNCAVGFSNNNAFARYQERSVIAPPPDVSTSIQISKTGQVKYSTIFLEPGPNREKANQTQVSASTDVLQSIYELPVSRGLHECRHLQPGPNGGGKEACLPSGI
ncbi:pilus assembly protein PilY [Archangium gephyra]|nr:pilus assembly protein PilY [Archangium gephyra]